MLPTVEEAMQYLGIEPEYADAIIDANVSHALAAAVSLLHGAVGKDAENVLKNDARITQLILIYTDDLYSDRTLSTKANAAQRRLVCDMELQLRMEYRRAKEGQS